MLSDSEAHHTTAVISAKAGIVDRLSWIQAEAEPVNNFETLSVRKIEKFCDRWLNFDRAMENLWTANAWFPPRPDGHVGRPVGAGTGYLSTGFPQPSTLGYVGLRRSCTLDAFGWLNRRTQALRLVDPYLLRQALRLGAPIDKALRVSHVGLESRLVSRRQHLWRYYIVDLLWRQQANP